tara:strand:+ start:408 stop:977 length:570 start_codon:yes stop_codon:yes gene_type:complete
MRKAKFIFFLSLVLSIYLFSRGAMSENKKELINLVLKDGTVVIETRPDLAPKHVAQIKNLVENGKYDGVVFHRVIQDFMAQTGDVQFGNSSKDSYNLSRAGTGGSDLSDIEAEFSSANHSRGAVSMARAQDPNSANSQFFICFKDCSFLDGQYSVWGYVIKGMEFVDNIKLGEPPQDPDKIIKMEIVSN